MPAAGLKVAAVAALMAVWWITEAIPIPATALLPIALFPILGVMGSSEVTASYANHLIYLYLGGFLIAATIQKWDLHKRIALVTIMVVGTSPKRIILGFMIATAFLSMWISNTATTMMMLPIGLAVIHQATSMLKRENDFDVAALESGDFRFATSLMLGIAYAASIGGIATLIGTPPNAILAGVIEETYGEVISFASWMQVGLPLAIVMLVVTWVYLTTWACPSEILPGGRNLISSELRKLGSITKEEKRVLIVFVLVALAWIARGIVQIEGAELIHDSTIAMLGGLALFLIPSDFSRGTFLLDWKTAVRIPWDIIILFGGGFALAGGFSKSGLTEWIAWRLSILEGTNVVILVATAALLVIFLTEITSNTATAALTLPIMAAFAEAMGIHPYGVMVTVAIAASYAFMMPVATPPNAIVFSCRYVSIPKMARVGFLLNLIGWVLLLLVTLVWLPIAWDFNLTGFSGIPGR
jgi:sodium-dependent dicarboxylate transporter 2/3/5